jgi:hypothetical protein
VQSLSSLVTSRVEVSDVVITKLSGYTGGIEAAVLLRGDFELGVDLSGAKFESMDRAEQSFVRPQPQASQPRLGPRISAARSCGLSAPTEARSRPTRACQSLTGNGIWI